MRANVLRHALFFVAGFTLVFVIIFGIPTTLLGNLVYAQRDLLSSLGGVLILILGLHLAGTFKWLAKLTEMGGGALRPLHQAIARAGATLDSIILPERRLQADGGASPGYLRSTLVGITFAAGWTPCIGPLLGLVLMLASVNPGQAFILLFAYSMGLAVPFLLTALLLSRAITFLRRINRFMNVIEIVSGLLLVVVGIMLIAGTFSRMNMLFSAAPAWLTGIETSILPEGSQVTLPLAFMAGLLSFLSPCVLPLVPIYLGYLSGTTVGQTQTAST
jgi:cytochrome c-type biogenesis protein